MDNVTKLKNLMVSACTSIKEGQRDIALSLLEHAADVMENVEPEVIETQFVTKVNNAAHEMEEGFKEETASEDDELEEMHPEVAHSSFRDILVGWDIGNGRTV